MRKITCFYLLFLTITVFAQATHKSDREVLLLDKAWAFKLDDISVKKGGSHSDNYLNTKANITKGPASPDFDDTKWRTLNLPHDWSVEMGFDANSTFSGKRFRGIGWYRRQFKLDENERGKSVEIQFDAIATYATVYINGILAHRNWCGYTSFYINITPFLKYGEEVNTIAVRVDANAAEGWWYEGAGIYRHTWLVKTNPIHVVTDGIYANPIRIAKNDWKLPLEVSLQNSSTQKSTVEVEAVLYDPKGKELIRKSTSLNINAFSKEVVKLNIQVDHPQLWDVDRPTLYTVKTLVKQNSNLIDSLTTNCGFRTLRFDAATGFYLNDLPLKIKGTCNHQDHAGVGAAVPEALWDFRIKKLKAMGSNAYRCAHNPPAKEFLDACDRLGMLVMDENRLFNTTPEYQGQLEWMVRRDRNHPSVILWSVFNEEPLQGTEIGYQMALMQKSYVNALDTTRLVTAAMNGGQFAKKNSAQAVDLVGFNYCIDTYDKFHANSPFSPMISTEDVSSVSQRGVYKTDLKNNLLADYDTEKMSWGDSHLNWWKAIDQRPFMAGCFVWTAFDYRGESAPLHWPAVNSSFGLMDLCGFSKNPYHILQAYWVDKPMLKLAPHWNWPADSVGKSIKVIAMTNADSVALFLNGKMLNSKKIAKYELPEWQVSYQTGKLEAKGYKNGKLIATDFVETTGEAIALQLIPDRKVLLGNGDDALPITVQALDKKGRVVPNANFLVKFDINGPAKNIGVGNGDPVSHESEKENQRMLYNGLAQLIIQSDEGRKGLVTVKASAEGMKEAVIQLIVTETAQIPAVKAVPKAMFVSNWLSSPVSKQRPDPLVQIADFDMNTWTNTTAGNVQYLDKNHYVIWRAKFTPTENVQNNGGFLVLKQLVGVSEIWINGNLIIKNELPRKDDLRLKLTPKSGETVVNILFKGLYGRVGIETLVSVTE